MNFIMMQRNLALQHRGLRGHNFFIAVLLEFSIIGKVAKNKEGLV